jgi:hypothetical protein
VHRERLVTGLAVVFGSMTAALVAVGLLVTPAVIAVALIFGVMTYVFWAHASGRLMSRVYRSVEDQARAGADSRRDRRARSQGGFGAGPREEWTAPRDGRTVTDDARWQARAQQERRGRRTRNARGQQRRRVEPDSPTVQEACDVLGVDPGSDESTVRRAYRERIKEVHPDADGDEEAFKRVQRAYDRLTD